MPEPTPGNPRKREIYLTADGAARLRTDLEELRGPRREDLARRLRHAVQQGDLSENADYITAKEEQAFLEGRIQELEKTLRQAQIVGADPPTEQIGVGSTVVVQEEGQAPQAYQIVGAKEADPRNGRISHESPIGMALMGKRPGEEAVARTPAGEIRMKVVEIR